MLSRNERQARDPCLHTDATCQARAIDAEKALDVFEQVQKSDSIRREDTALGPWCILISESPDIAAARAFHLSQLQNVDWWIAQQHLTEVILLCCGGPQAEHIIAKDHHVSIHGHPAVQIGIGGFV